MPGRAGIATARTCVNQYWLLTSSKYDSCTLGALLSLLTIAGAEGDAEVGTPAHNMLAA